MSGGGPIVDDAFGRMRGYLGRSEHRLVGLMTGTSADAVDAALVVLYGDGPTPRAELTAYRETPLEGGLRREILEVAAAETMPLERVMRLDAALGERYAAAVLELLAAAKVEPGRVDAIGSHGQTVRHLPRHVGGGIALTLQIGSASILAERTGITVVSNFRARDTAAGGEGAPLVPLVDWWLFRTGEESRVLLNVGGIANLTLLPRDAGARGCAGVRHGSGQRRPRCARPARERRPERLRRRRRARRAGPGQRRAAHGAAGGSVLRPSAAAPRRDASSSVRPMHPSSPSWGPPWASRPRICSRPRSSWSPPRWPTPSRSLRAPRASVDVTYVSGGGVRNTALMAALARRLRPTRVAPLSTLGVEPAAKEALAFALLAHRTLCGLAGNVPGRRARSTRSCSDR